MSIKGPRETGKVGRKRGSGRERGNIWLVNPTIENFLLLQERFMEDWEKLIGGEYVSSVLKNWKFDGNSQVELFYLADPRVICNVSFKHFHTLLVYVCGIISWHANKVWGGGSILYLQSDYDNRITGSVDTSEPTFPVALVSPVGSGTK